MKSLSMSSGYKIGKHIKDLFARFLEYGSYVWDPQGRTLQEEIEKVQNTVARFVTSYYCIETGSMTGILEILR